jgi:hypothetical protein
MQHDQLGRKVCYVTFYHIFLNKSSLDMIYSQGHEYKGKIKERELLMV